MLLIASAEHICSTMVKQLNMDEEDNSDDDVGTRTPLRCNLFKYSTPYDLSTSEESSLAPTISVTTNKHRTVTYDKYYQVGRIIHLPLLLLPLPPRIM